VTAGFLASSEYQWHQASVTVQQLYQNLLGRPAGSSEVSTFATSICNGWTTCFALEEMVLDSVEYYSRAHNDYP
jgi:hypothetical protein